MGVRLIIQTKNPARAVLASAQVKLLPIERWMVMNMRIISGVVRYMPRVNGARRVMYQSRLMCKFRASKTINMLSIYRCHIIGALSHEANAQKMIAAQAIPLK
jgi:hypothetical protein